MQNHPETVFDYAGIARSIAWSKRRKEPPGRRRESRELRESNKSVARFWLIQHRSWGERILNCKVEIRKAKGGKEAKGTEQGAGSKERTRTLRVER